MQNHTQNPSAVTRIEGSVNKIGIYQAQQVTKKAETSSQISKKQELHSVFNLVKSIKGKQAVICTALTGEQATSLVSALANELNSPLLIKFSGMEVAR